MVYWWYRKDNKMFELIDIEFYENIKKSGEGATNIIWFITDDIIQQNI